MKKKKAPSKPAAPVPTLLELRGKIDAVDDQVLRLLEERAGLAREVGEVKKAVSGSPGFYDPERERRILERLARASKGSFPREAIPYVFKEIIGACRALETEIRVAYLGPAGTYSQIAAQRSFGQSVQYQDAGTIQEVFDAVARGVAEFGVVPLENSYEGGVTQTLGALLTTELRVQRELFLPINHCLLCQGEDLSAIKRVYSHPQGIAQCRRWLSDNLPTAELVETPSTAAASRIAAQEKGSAAIASALSAEIFGLKVLRQGIQTQDENVTRFVVLAREDAKPTGQDRTSLVFSVRKGRQLVDVLDHFRRARIRTARVESKSSAHDGWRAHYFVDLEGHRLEKKVERALKSAARDCEAFSVLGSYPRAKS